MLLNRDRANEVMDKYELDGLLAATRQNIYYLSDVWSYSMRVERHFNTFAVLPRKESAAAGLVIGMTEHRNLADKPTWMPNVVGVSGRISPTAANVGSENKELQGDPMAIYLLREGGLTDREQSWVDAAKALTGKVEVSSHAGLVRAVNDAGLENARIGVDDPRLIDWLHDLGMKGVTGIDASRIFREIRMVKSPAEIELMRKAAEINEAAMEVAIDAVHEGATMKDLETAFMVEMAKRGGKGIYILFGMIGDLRHGRVVRDEPFLVDALGVYEHYHGDIGRMLHVGEPGEEVLKRSKAMQAGWKAACDALKPGVVASDVVKIVMDTMHREGFEAFNHCVAHSVGLEHTDMPFPVTPDDPKSSDFVLQENMVLNFDMPFLEYGWGSMHLEDTLLVTTDGWEPLTSLRTELRIIDPI
jgi:Xaa-Pro aminopeptidase